MAEEVFFASERVAEKISPAYVNIPKLNFINLIEKEIRHGDVAESFAWWCRVRLHFGGHDRSNG